MFNKLLLVTAACTWLVAGAGCAAKTTAAKVADPSVPSHQHMQGDAGQSAEALPSKPVTVALINKKGEPAGTAVLTQVAEGVQVSLDAYGLKPGPHGIHFHELAKCEKPDFKSAGEHFNPFGKHHGLNNPQGAHAGDMPNIVAGADGKVKTQFVTKLATLGKGPANSLQKAGGTALVIHESPDDQKSDPAGNSGARIACGVIPGL